MKKLPIGIQNIREIIEEGYVYVDKTSFAHQLISTGKHYFLSRPRRFGKSLFVDTLAEIFKGNKELLKQCAIAQTDYHWQPYPIIRLDLYTVPCKSASEFEAGLKRAVHDLAELHGVALDVPTPQEGLKKLVEQLYAKHQQPIVVLVDEYDKPLITNLERPKVAYDNREMLREFFGMLKSLDRLLKFTFTTGVSRFSKVSLFSGPNNLDDITMNVAYATMMGYTEEELQNAFAAHIQHIAQVQRTTPAEVLATIKYWYNGYRFTEEAACVYNPFSTLKYMSERKPKSYWYASGTPAFLVKALQNYPAGYIPLEELRVSESELMDNSTVEAMDVKALMFQTGYLTIEDYDDFGQLYALAFPNQEVQEAFVDSLAKKFAPHVASLAQVCAQALEGMDLGPFFEAIAQTLSGFPYWLFSRERAGEASEPASSPRERTYHMILLSLLKGMGFSVAAEVPTSKGRIDLLLQTQGLTYVIEVKLDRSAEEALKQIHARGYHTPYLNQGKQVVLLGLNFSSAARNVDGWLGEVLDHQGVTIRYLNPEQEPEKATDLSREEME